MVDHRPPLAALLLGALIAVPGEAADGGATVEEAFGEASAQVGEDDAAAVVALLRLVREQPAADLAPDALMLAAEVEEERLRRPARALDHYEELLARYPSSRQSIRAAHRRDFLRRGLGAGEAPLAEYQAILRDFAHRPDEALRRMARLVDDHPSFPERSEAGLWLGHRALGRGDVATAERWFTTVEGWGGERRTLIAARRGRAAAAHRGGRLREAERRYRDLAAEASASDGEGAREGLRTARLAVARYVAAWIAVACLLLLLGAGLWRARRALFPLPAEVRYYLPVALLLTVAAATEDRAITGAVAAIAVGGALITWSTAAGSRRAPARSAAAIVRRAMVPVVAVLALVYAAVYFHGLSDLVLETLRHGPER